MSEVPFFKIVFLFWIIMDSPGNVPLFVNLLKHYDIERQKKIIVRELFISLFVMVAFLFFGKQFLGVLAISHSSLQIGGGVILMLLAIRMIFSSPKEEKLDRLPKEPMIVPLAIPAIAGPGILATITLYSGSMGNPWTVLLAVILAWLFSVPVLFFAPFLKKKLGLNAMIAIERLFGYIIVLISMEMIVSGFLSNFVK